MPEQTIEERSLRTLFEVTPQCSACVVGLGGGYAVSVQVGDSKRVLANTRGAVRLFSLENAARFLHSVGVKRFEIDTTNFIPGRLRKARPDRAEALKRTRTMPRQETLI